MLLLHFLFSGLLIGLSVISAELLPPDGFLGKWHKDGPPRVFQGADLYGHINGGSELFLEFGFEKLTVQNYRSTDGEFSLELYRMTDPVAATGVYLMKKGQESADPSLPVPHTISAYQLIFARDRYLVVLNSAEGDEKDEKDMLDFGSLIASRLPESPPIRHFALLPSEGLLTGSRRLIRGMYALQSIFTLGPENILSLSPGQTAIAGDYEASGASFTRIVSEYPDEGAALAAFGRLRSHLDPYLKVVGQDASTLVFEDYAKEYGVVSLFGRQLNIRLHLKQKPEARHPEVNR